jgi:uncharacterized protein (DUF433 family)
VGDAEVDALIEQEPGRPGRHNARLVESGTHVWAIIAYLQGTDWDIARVAEDYGVSEQSVRAAIGYYERHRDLIDAELLLQHEALVAG